MNDETYMQRCIELAALGAGSVSPNPLVGSLIVKDGKIIGEGWHRKFGEAHAEVNAMHGLSENELEGSTLYVNLEPCSHTGKTPPCANKIAGSGIRKVVIGMTDPNPLVSGRGIKILEESGIEVKTGILESECKFLNRRFITGMTRNRPYIILKWAQSSDGFIGKKGERIQLTGQVSMMLNHKWRTEEDAILIGYRTLVTDNPELTARHWKGPNPLRVVISKDDIPEDDLNFFNEQAESLVIKAVEPVDILQKLHKKGIASVIVEGGRATLNKFIAAGLWDEARVFVSNQYLTEGVSAPVFPFSPDSSENTGDDRLLLYHADENLKPAT